jgi:AraC-like DNA-binding protein
MRFAYCELPPPPALAPFVRCFWTLQGELPPRFRPGGAAAFFRFPMSEVRDAILPAGEVLRLDERSVVDVLLKRRTVPRQWRAVSAAIQIIESRKGNVRIGALAKHIGISERTLQRSFEDAVGILPKTFARLTRFQTHLADPEADAGYVDASHLTRDFHDFAGVTPARYERERHELRDHFAGNVQDA